MENKTEIYQLCPHSGYLMESYLIKTPNNKIIMIDGGSNTYMEKAYLPSAIRAILGLKEVPKPDDSADAVAVAICHLQTNNELNNNMI